MPIHIVDGDIFNSNAEAWIVPVNVQGSMGAGLAMAFKFRYVHLFLEYKDLCDKKKISVGKVVFFEQKVKPIPKWIVLFPTKKEWAKLSKIEYIEDGLVHLELELENYKIKSLAMPALGCGRGGLPWYDVKALIQHKLSNSPVEIMLYPPKGI
jgi:O-acetyl-ADP-ribose deacetylase (regulator of RNase III)